MGHWVPGAGPRDEARLQMTLAWARGKGRASPKPDTDAPVWPVLAELGVYTATRRLIGWTAPEGERSRDWIHKSNEVELVVAVPPGLDEARSRLRQPE